MSGNGFTYSGHPAMESTLSALPKPAVYDPSGAYPQPEGRGPGGRPLCRWCHLEVGARRRTFCSARCVEAFKLQVDWKYIRQHVRDRDRGVCRICRCDTEKLRRVASHANRHNGRRGWRPWSFRGSGAAWLRSLGFRPRTALWQADHVTPRCYGGGNELANLRTLCLPCHKSVTTELAAARAAERRMRIRPNALIASQACSGQSLPGPLHQRIVRLG